MPNALLRSAGSVKVVVSSDSAAGASMAANAPCSARAPTSTPKVCAAPAEQQQAAEREGVGGDHPLAVVVGEVQVLLGRRERDVHDRHVEHHQQLGDADDGEDQPAPVVVCGAGWGGGLRHVLVSFGHVGGVWFVTAMTNHDQGM